MREWINLISRTLHESWYATADLENKHVDLFANPSRAEWAKLFRECHHGLRGHITTDGTLLVWDAMLAVHSEIDRYLASQGKKITSGYRYFYPDHIVFNDLQLELNEEENENEGGEIPRYGWYVRNTFETTMKNASVRAQYGDDPKIIGKDYDVSPSDIVITQAWVQKNCALRP